MIRSSTINDPSFDAAFANTTADDILNNLSSNHEQQNQTPPPPPPPPLGKPQSSIVPLTDNQIKSFSISNSIVSGSQVPNDVGNQSSLITVTPTIIQPEGKDGEKIVAASISPSSNSAATDSKQLNQRKSSTIRKRVKTKYTGPPLRLKLKETEAASIRHVKLHNMIKDKRLGMRIMSRIVVCSSFLDPVFWFVSFFFIYIFVRPAIVNPDRTGWELTRRVRSISKGFETVDDSASMFTFLRHQLIPSLAPKDPSIEMYNTYMDFITKEEASGSVSNVQTLNDGRLSVTGSKIFIRQIRAKNMFEISPKDEEKDELESWMWVNQTSSYHTLQNVCQNTGMKTEPEISILPKYVSSSTSKNTETYSPLTGNSYTGSGYITTLDLSLRHIDGPTNINDVIDSGKRLRNGMIDRSKCLDEKLNQMQKVGWIDSRTKAVMVEYCVVPFFLSHTNWYRNPNTTNRRGTDFELQLVDGIDGENIGTGGCQRIIFEIDQFGTIDSSQFFITSPISSSATRNDGLVVMSVLLISLTLLLWNEALEIYVTGPKIYLCTRSRALFNLLDFCAILFILLTLMSFPNDGVPFGPEDASAMFKNPEKTHLAFSKLGEMDNCRKWFSSLLVVWWARSLEYLSLFPALQVPVFTISRATVPIFSILVFIIMVTFAISYGVNIVFGASVVAFADLTSTYVTLVQASLGEIVLDGFGLDTRWSIVGPVFVSIWAFVMMFVVLTMFVAIIDESFGSVREDVESARNEEILARAEKKKTKKMEIEDGVDEDDEEVGAKGHGLGDMSVNVIRKSCRRKNCCNWCWCGLCRDKTSKVNPNL
jgi:hypothetical protein